MSAVPFSRSVKFDQGSEASSDMIPTPSSFTYVLTSNANIPGPIWEPACGRGHMVNALRKKGNTVVGSDIHGYGQFNVIADFLTTRLPGLERPKAIVTNPPFARGVEFVERGLFHMLHSGVEFLALLMAVHWMGSEDRYDKIFSGPNRPSRIIVISNRMVMPTLADGKRRTHNFNHAWYIWHPRPKTRTGYNPPTSITWAMATETQDDEQP